MRVVLDTHGLLWFLAGDARLSERAREVISDPGTGVVVSVASLWEIAIKVSLGKLELDRPYEDLVPKELERNSIGVLGIEPRHLVRVVALPFHHRDPFDRLIIGQALEDGFSVVSRDEQFDTYGVERIW